MLLFGSSSGSTLVARPRAAPSKVFVRACWDWAGMPSGRLGWVSAHTALNSGSGSYPAVADALQLHPDDQLLELGCGSGGFLPIALRRPTGP